MLLWPSNSFKSPDRTLSRKEKSAPTGGQRPAQDADQAAANQYPALNGLLMRSANGDTSNSLSVGIFSPLSVIRSMPAGNSACVDVLFASFARSAWLVYAERATEKNRST